MLGYKLGDLQVFFKLQIIFYFLYFYWSIVAYNFNCTAM